MQSMRTFTRRAVAVLALSLVLAACASAPRRADAPIDAGASSPPVRAESAAALDTGEAGRDIHWFRRSAERRAAYAQAYLLAWERVESATRALGRPWAVVLDADETVLDNSAFQEERARAGHANVTSAEFDAWTLRVAADVFPEARDFVRRVRAHGGKVVIVSNRREATCEATRANLRRLDVPVDAVLCAPPGNSDKQPRFDAVTAGAAVPGAGPLETVLYVGDNIKDCPGQTQERVDPTLFGTRCIVVPNPMYGSWVPHGLK